jgi:hypothetical protein
MNYRPSLFKELTTEMQARFTCPFFCFGVPGAPSIENALLAHGRGFHLWKIARPEGYLTSLRRRRGPHREGP